MEIDLNVIALGLTIAILGIIVCLVTFWSTSGQLGKRLTRVLRNQDTIMRFLLKDHQDRQNEKVLDERVATETDGKGESEPAPAPGPETAAIKKPGPNGKRAKRAAAS